jgi:hypothetical protein
MRRFFEVPVRSIIPLPQVAHTASPVRRMGPVVTRGATTLGLRACSCRWTRENTSRSIIAGTETSTISPSLRRLQRNFTSNAREAAAFQNDIRRFESSMPSQAVRSLLFDFWLCRYCRHSRGLCWRARVSDGQIPDSRVWTGGFAAPVSAHHFPISVSACPRPQPFGDAAPGVFPR